MYNVNLLSVSIIWTTAIELSSDTMMPSLLEDNITENVSLSSATSSFSIRIVGLKEVVEPDVWKDKDCTPPS